MVHTMAVLGGSFNPPGVHHGLIAARLLEDFDELLVVPCGSQRADKACLRDTSSRHRKAMIRLAFGKMPRAALDYSDLDGSVYTPTIRLYERCAAQYPGYDLWFAVGGDLVRGGSRGLSQIQQAWVEGQRVWRQLNLAVIDHPGCPVEAADLPPHHRRVAMPEFFGRASLIRERLARGLDVSGLVQPEIGAYIAEHGLYRMEA